MVDRSLSAGGIAPEIPSKAADESAVRVPLAFGRSQPDDFVGMVAAQRVPRVYN
jgi:hypothetical protein